MRKAGVLMVAAGLCLGVALPAQAVDSATPAPSITASPTPVPSTSAPMLTNRLTVEYNYAKGLGKASDKRGIAPSLYTGKWYSKKAERKRRCIVRKETGGVYTSVSSNGRYRGAYQMSRPLAVGATWMMQPEVKKDFGPQAAAVVAKLRKIPTQKWNRYWQDRAFFTIWRDGKGRSHWPLRGC